MASAVDKTGTELPLAADRACIIDRRGRHMVAVARKLLTLVYYGLRDGEIRVLAPWRLCHDATAWRGRPSD